MGMMECELQYCEERMEWARDARLGVTARSAPHSRSRTKDMQAVGEILKRVAPPVAQSVRVLVNFPLFWKMVIDMVKAGSGYEFKYEIVVPGADLRERASIAELVDIAILPKSIGGEAVSVDADSNEDENNVRGVEHPTFSALLEKLEMEGVLSARS